MNYLLKLDIFFFDAKTDFLPYYKTLHVKAKKGMLLSDLLQNEVSKKERNFSLPANKYIHVKVNNVITPLSVSIEDIMNKFNTTDLKIEPISEYRATVNFDINTDDFYEKLNFFDIPLDKEDKKKYEKLISYYYASVALEYEKKYFGDSFFIFASHLIKKYPSQKKDILAIISDEKFGIWLHVNLRNIIFHDEMVDEIENVITNLKYEILITIPKINKITKLQSKNLAKL